LNAAPWPGHPMKPASSPRQGDCKGKRGCCTFDTKQLYNLNFFFSASPSSARVCLHTESNLVGNHHNLSVAKTPKRITCRPIRERLQNDPAFVQVLQVCVLCQRRKVFGQALKPDCLKSVNALSYCVLHIVPAMHTLPHCVSAP
jgi:hypothetical protein